MGKLKNFEIMLKESAASDAAEYIEQLERENKTLRLKLEEVEAQKRACKTFFNNFMVLAENVVSKKEKEIEKLKKENDLLNAQIIVLQQHMYNEILAQKLNEENI